MAKDPAFLFYFRDFLVSTELMTAEEVGGYIRILSHMADKGRLSLKHMQSICKAYDTAYELHSKFRVDEKGLYYNVKLEEELEKRRNYTQSRRENAKHMHQHMGNASINGNVVKNTSKTTKLTFDFDILWQQYPNKLGKKEAERHFHASVKTNEDYLDIQKAIENYIKKSKGTEPKFIKHGSTWFNNWRDWVDYKTPNTEQAENDQRDIWQSKANKSCTNCRGSGAVYAPGSGNFGKCGCVK